MKAPLFHLTSALQLTPEIINSFLHASEKMEKTLYRKGRSTLLEDSVIALLFYEPSSRTMLSFQTAVQRLGGGMILAQGKNMSSLDKGESVEDTIRMVMSYADCIVMRHPDAGSAQRAAEVSLVPFINAGDGGNEHPTQAILDLYTIKREIGRLSRLHVAFACDPLHSRTIRSLALTLSQYPDNRFTFISPESLRAGKEFLKVLEERGTQFEETTDLAKGLDADILYMNRLQEERFEDHGEFEGLRKEYTLTAAHLVGRNTLVMDPLPRIDEIAADVDALPNAAYFRQARNGVPVRMAILAAMLGKI